MNWRPNSEKKKEGEMKNWRKNQWREKKKKKRPNPEKKKKRWIEDWTVKKKKRERQKNWRKNQWRKKKKRVKGQKLWLWVPPCVFNYKNAIELWVMKTENS